MKTKIKKGFTLAETLITLTILGVVATVVIPNIIKNYQKRMTITRLKMAYSMLDNMTQQSMIENGYPPSGVAFTQDLFNNYFGKYLYISKVCGMTGTKGCFKLNSNGRDTYYSLDGTEMISNSAENYYKVVLKNGMSLGVTSQASTAYAYRFLIDINGPNRGDSKLGQDMFQFTYYSKAAITSASLTGTAYNNYTACPNAGIFIGSYSPANAGKSCQATRNLLKGLCSEGGSTSYGSDAAKNKIFPNGAGCAGLIIKDGWKISDDYPWDEARKKP